MNFDLTDEQRLLKESVERLADALGSVGAHSPARSQSVGRDGTTWSRLAEMGLLGLPFAEDDGGFGGGSIETMIVMEALGRGLIIEPYLGSIVLSGALLRHGAAGTTRRALAPRIAAGDLVISFAHSEPQTRYHLSDVTTTARRNGSGWTLDGRKCGVMGGDCADLVIVSARSSGSRFDRGGLCLFLVEPDSTGFVRRGYTALDGTRGADIVISELHLPDGALLGEAGCALPVIERAADIALAASLAEAVGIMDAMLKATVEYLKTRSQFGRKIGEFQALQHRAADMLVATEQARSMAIFAASMAEADEALERRRAISGAKVVVSQSLRFVSQQAVQLHGGIGVTEECAIGPYFKRATALETFLGDFDHHLALLAEMGGFIEPEMPDRVIAHR